MAPSQDEMRETYAGEMVSTEARDLFLYLCDYGRSLKDYSFTLRDKGYLRTAKYEKGGKWPFAFIVNRSDILFYIRKAGRSHAAASVDNLRAQFPDVKQNNRDEIQFHVATGAQARLLMRLLFEQKESD